MYAYQTSQPDLSRAAFAFQPIVDAETAQPIAYHLVLRCPTGSSEIGDACLAEGAIDAAVAAGLGDAGAPLLLPVATGGECPERVLQAVFRAALIHNLPLGAIVIAANAGEYGDARAAMQLVTAAERLGFTVALDAFAAAPAGIQLFARVTPRFVRIDTALVRNIDCSGARRQVVESVVRLARRTGAEVIAPGIRTPAELAALHAAGVRHVEGDWIAPAAARLTGPNFSGDAVLGFARMTAPRRQNAALARREIGPAHRRLQHHQRMPGGVARPTEYIVQQMPLPA